MPNDRHKGHCNQYKHGHTVNILVPEPEDILLNVRVKRINAICRAEGIENTILISIHPNVAGDGTKWLNADRLPHPIRMEANVVWLHIDVLEQYGIDEKVHLFNP